MNNLLEKVFYCDDECVVQSGYVFDKHGGDFMKDVIYAGRFIYKKLSCCWNSSRYDKISDSGGSANRNHKCDLYTVGQKNCTLLFLQ